MLKSLFLFTLVITLKAQDFYHIKLFQAESGHQEELKNIITDNINVYTSRYNLKANLIQHKQGDFWDFMLIIPLKNNSIPIYSKELPTFNFTYASQSNALILHQSDYLFRGPTYSDWIELADKHTLFHVEMFIPIPGKEKELFNEREMETKYLQYVGYNGNFTFTKVFGGEYSIMTIGLYKNFQDFASQEAIPLDKDNEAARKSGFKSVGDIGYYLRKLIRRHEDTIAKKVY